MAGSSKEKEEEGETMNVQNRKLSELTPYQGNAKKHDKKQIANVAESIRQYGFVQPIVVDRDDVIIIGHCRALAAKKARHGRGAVCQHGRFDAGTSERPPAGGQ